MTSKDITKEKHSRSLTWSRKLVVWQKGFLSLALFFSTLTTISWKRLQLSATLLTSTTSAGSRSNGYLPPFSDASAHKSSTRRSTTSNLCQTSTLRYQRTWKKMKNILGHFSQATHSKSLKSSKLSGKTSRKRLMMNEKSLCSNLNRNAFKTMGSILMRIARMTVTVQSMSNGTAFKVTIHSIQMTLQTKPNREKTEITK